MLLQLLQNIHHCQYRAQLLPHMTDFLFVELVYWETISVAQQAVRSTASVSVLPLTTSLVLSALVLYEYVLTIEDERALVWQPKWTTTTVLFVLNRVLMLFAAISQLTPYSYRT